MNQKLKKKGKTNNGITLIALVITIIVLLILAGVSIATLNGPNGILTRANDAKEQSEMGKEREQISLAYTSQKSDLLSKGSTDKILANDLKDQLIKDGVKVKSVTGTDELTITMESGRIYTIDNNGKIELLPTVEMLQNMYEFKYYSKLIEAVEDVNNNTIHNANSDSANAEAGVYINEDNIPVIVLMKDTAIIDRIKLQNNMEFNLGGKTLFLYETAFIDIYKNTVIDGRISGSRIEQNTTIANRGIIVGSEEEVILQGGQYSLKYNLNDESKEIIPIHGYSNNLIMNNCEVNIEATGNVKVAYGVYANSTARITINSCKINAKLDINSTTQLIASTSGGNIEINNSELNVGSDNGTCCAINNFGTMMISSTNIFADAKGCSADLGTRIYAVGIINNGTLNFNSGKVFGTHSGISTRESSKTYVNGGEFTSCGHGGFYFSNIDGEAYIENATISCVDYTGKYDIDKTADWQLAGFYIGGSANANNISVYMNNCNISGGNKAFVLRGTSGEQNNKLYISNSTIGNNQIRIDNDTLKLYVGNGTNITADKTNNPSCVEFTNETYKK